MPTRQRRRPIQTVGSGSGAGKGVDFYGGPAIDPTENVLALHDAEARHRDDLRTSDARYFTELAKAETKRIDDLAKQRSEFNIRLDAQRDSSDTRIAEMLRAQTQSNSDLVAKQLDRLITTYDTRIAAVERSQYESGGKAAVMDPTVSDALKTIAGLKQVESTTHGRSEGQGQIGILIVVVISAVSSLVAMLVGMVNFFSRITAP